MDPPTDISYLSKTKAPKERKALQSGRKTPGGGYGGTASHALRKKRGNLKKFVLDQEREKGKCLNWGSLGERSIVGKKKANLFTKFVKERSTGVGVRSLANRMKRKEAERRKEGIFITGGK